MRRVLVTVAVAVLSTAAVFADEIRAGATTVSAYVSDVGFGHSSSGDTWTGGGGLAIERAWTNRITTVLSIGAERQRQNSSYSVEPPTPNQPFTRYIFQRTYRTTYPLDFLARYHFVTESLDSVFRHRRPVRQRPRNQHESDRGVRWCVSR